MWSKMPFVRILIPFIIGILAYRAFPAEFTFNSILFIVIAILTLLAAWLFVFKSLISYSIRLVQSVLLLICVLLLDISWLITTILGIKVILLEIWLAMSL